MKRVPVVGRITAPRPPGDPTWAAGSRQIVAQADIGTGAAVNFGSNISVDTGRGWTVPSALGAIFKDIQDLTDRGRP